MINQITQREIYEDIYHDKKEELSTIFGFSEDKASRLANIKAVKNTWVEFQNLQQFKLKTNR